jgi:hypothetical protein
MSSSDSGDSKADPITIDMGCSCKEDMKETSIQQAHHLDMLMNLSVDVSAERVLLDAARLAQRERGNELQSQEECLLQDNNALEMAQKLLARRQARFIRSSLKALTVCEDELSVAKMNYADAKERHQNMANDHWDWEDSENAESPDEGEESKDTGPEDTGEEEEGDQSVEGDSSESGYDALGSETENDIRAIVDENTKNGVSPDIGTPPVVVNPTLRERLQMASVAKSRERIMRKAAENKWMRLFKRHWEGAWVERLAREMEGNGYIRRRCMDRNRQRRAVRRMAVRAQQLSARLVPKTRH